MKINSISLAALLGAIPAGSQLTSTPLFKTRSLEEAAFPAGSESMSISLSAIESYSNGGVSSKGTKSSKAMKGIGFDPNEYAEFDAAAKSFDDSYLGDYETIDTTDISTRFGGKGAPFVFDLGSTSSLTRRRGIDITLAEIRAIWKDVSHLVGDNDGIVLKSVGDSLFILFNKVSDGLAATRAMYLAVIARWRAKVERACGVGSKPQEWCERADEEEERKRFYNTAAVGGAFGDLIVIGKEGNYVDAYGASVNNAFFAAEEDAEHGEFLIDEGGMQSLLEEAGGPPQDTCGSKTVEWNAGDFGINRFIVKSFAGGAFCYYTACFDAECKIPDDE